MLICALEHTIWGFFPYGEEREVACITFLSEFQVRHALGEYEWRGALAVSQILSCRFPLQMPWRLHLRDMCLPFGGQKTFICISVLMLWLPCIRKFGAWLAKIDGSTFLRLPSLYLLPPGPACWPHWRHATRCAKMRATMPRWATGLWRSCPFAKSWDGCNERGYGSKISLMWIWEPKYCW